MPSESLCPKPVFVDDGWPLGQCLRKPNHDGRCDVSNGDQQLDPGPKHYAGRLCAACGSNDLEPHGMGCETWRYTCRTCKADPA